MIETLHLKIVVIFFYKLFKKNIAITCKNLNSVHRAEISTRFSQPDMKFQPGMKNANVPYNQHFF